jgi:hypothetical protein
MAASTADENEKNPNLFGKHTIPGGHVLAGIF